ncbi:MAG: cupin domain-containing protein [Acidimicrobiales bacterium]
MAATLAISEQAIADHAPVHVDALTKVTVDDRIKVNTKDLSEVTTYRITLQPGGATPWHYHPGPHMVSVGAGTVTVYEADCATTPYPAGQGFFDPGKSSPPSRQHVHLARNDGSVPAVLLVTDIRRPGEPLRVDVPAPASCF